MKNLASLYDTGITQKKRIITFGMTEAECCAIRATMKQGFVLCETEMVSDLIAIPAYMLIIRGDALNEHERRLLLGYYKIVGEDADEIVCWIGPPASRTDLPVWFRCGETVEQVMMLQPQDMPAQHCCDETADTGSEDIFDEVRDALIDSVTEAQFDAMVLLSEASFGRYVMRADMNMAGNVMYYELFDEDQGEVYLLVISHCDEPFSRERIEVLEPNYCQYECVSMSREEKEFYIENWLIDQPVDSLPPLLRELAVRLHALSE